MPFPLLTNVGYISGLAGGRGLVGQLLGVYRTLIHENASVIVYDNFTVFVASRQFRLFAMPS